MLFSSITYYFYKIKQIKGEDIVLPKNTFTKDSSDFISWNTIADGSGVSYDDEDIVKNITQDVTLYAQWGKSINIDYDKTKSIYADQTVDILKIKSNVEEQTGQLLVEQGTLTAQKVIIEKTIDASRYFFFSLPFDCNISDIVAIGEEGALAYYDNYSIFYYDQVHAATKKDNSKAWKEWICLPT